MNIILGPIPLLQPKSSPFYTKTTKNTTSLVFYLDNIFRSFKTYQKQYIFSHDHFILCIVLTKLKLVFFKLKIRIINIFMLEKEHKIDKKIKLKLDKIEKIFTWLIF